MSNTPQVSVVVPFFNAGPFLEEAIAGVLGQSYPHWELLLVDDGSTDVSSQTGRRYAARHPDRVSYLEHPGHVNLGLPVTENLGLRHARGKYIALLHADDVWLPKKLEQQTAALERNSTAGMIYGASQYWFGWTAQPADIASDNIPGLGVPPDTLVPPPRLLAWCLNGKARTPCFSDVLIRRDVLDQVGGFVEAFAGDNQVYEGHAVVAKVALESSVVLSGECWNRYRQHRSSMHARLRRTGRLQRARAHYLHWLRRQLIDRHITDNELWQALEQQLAASHQSTVHVLAGNLRDRFKGVRRRVWRAVRPSGRHGTAVGDDPFARLRRLDPIDRGYGWSRGVPVDRYYIERFLETHARDIHGRVLEIGDRTYTTKFGGERVEKSDVLHAAEGNVNATVVADLTCADAVPSDAFDCVILTQTLPFIYETQAAVRELFRILRPGGVVLATVPGISPIIRKDMAAWGDFWRFTSLSARRLFEQVFPIGNVSVEARGNVMTAVAFLHGIASGELSQKELDHGDPDYEVIITVRAVKPDDDSRQAQVPNRSDPSCVPS